MTGMRSEFLRLITERGQLHQCTDAEALDAVIMKDRITCYIGFDCTAPSLHVGSLLQIMLLRWWQKCGHTPIVLLGGGTTKIGDPSGKDESRPVISDETIAENMASIRGNHKKSFLSDRMSWAVFVKSLSFLGVKKFEIVLTLYHENGRTTVHNRTISLEYTE